MVDVEEGWMWREVGCEERVVDVEEGWMWREGGGCGGRVVDVEREWMWREVTPVLLVLQSLPTHAILYTWATLSTSPTDISLSTGTIGGWWMWRKGGCEGRVVDVEGGWWM